MTGNLGDEANVEHLIQIILSVKIRDAMNARITSNLPSSSTDSYRLVNGEGDGLSGLAIDIIGGLTGDIYAVIMSSAVWCEIHKKIIKRVVERILLSDHPNYFNKGNDLKLVWRNTPTRLLQVSIFYLRFY